MKINFNSIVNIEKEKEMAFLDDDMERQDIEKRIRFLKDLMHHWEQDVWMGEISRKEYRDACADVYEEIEKLEKQLD